jgi:probable phosphoglycerate mutase
MTTFLLIRHGDTDAVDHVLAGSAPGWHLNARGLQQVRSLAQRLSSTPIRAVYTSPLERAIETAEAIAASRGIPLERVDELVEFGLGEWEGLAFGELDGRDDWRRFNSFRSGTRAPGGELMVETQARMVRQLDRLRARHPHDTIAVVSHGDPLRAALAWFLGIPIDLIFRFELGTASLSVVEVHDRGARVLCLNHRGELPV